MNRALHACHVKRDGQTGLYYSQCSCGYEGRYHVHPEQAGEERTKHLCSAMQANPMANWTLWMQMDLPDEKPQA